MKVLIENLNKETNIKFDVLEKLFSKINDPNTFAIVLVGIDEIKKLNEKYRKINEPTDVLSFPTNNIIKGDLGDVFICSDIVLKRATENKSLIDYELAFLAVHGYLHLKGYTHDDSISYNIMMDKTYEILSKVFTIKGELL